MRQLELQVLMTMTFLLTLAPPAIGGDDSVPADMRDFFNALQTVETGGEEDPATAVGDNGASLGWYQIQRAYWQDATERDWGHGGAYEDVTNRRYAERVMMAYWQRYAPDALRDRDFKTLARIHNGGPKGHRKKATLSYWRDVQHILRSSGGKN